MPLTERESAEVAAANASGKPTVAFIHGLWLLAGSWGDWRTYFEDQGYATIAPGWPDDPETTAEANENPEVFADKGVGEITDHLAEVLGGLNERPILIGHSFGGLLVQKLAGMSLAKITVAIDPAPFRGVLPLPFSALKASFPVLKNPANKHKATKLTYEQFRYAFANVVSEEEAHELYEKYSVAGSGVPLFEAASANLNPHTDASVDTKNPDRGPLLILDGDNDHTVPWAIANSEYKKYKDETDPTEIIKVENRGHSLTIDSGWKEVADISLKFIKENGG